ncbi:MAG: hypothetical protein IPN84_18045 [Sphingomonadales bacterium]|nr:hypothetical protein [Sphingomonadales bacterium]
MTMAAPFSVAAIGLRKKEATMTRLVSYKSDAAAEMIVVDVLLRGKGPLVVLLPSLGRSASDFDDLSSRIAAAGFRTAAINPRGIGKSKGSAANCWRTIPETYWKRSRLLQTGKGSPFWSLPC